VTISPTDVSLTCSPTCSSQLGYIATVQIQPFTLLTPILAPIRRPDDHTDVVAGGIDDVGARPRRDALAIPSPTPVRQRRQARHQASPTPPSRRHRRDRPGADASPTPACFALPTAHFNESNSGKKRRDSFSVTDQSTSEVRA
jgi:hypothetical protein